MVRFHCSSALPFWYRIVFSDCIYGLDVSHDGSVVIGCSNGLIIAHNTATGAIIWLKNMPQSVWSLRIHGSLVVVPVDDSNVTVLDINTGQQILDLPSAGKSVRAIRVFNGLPSDMKFIKSFFKKKTPIPCF